MELYHVFNRGVDKRNIFLDDSDRVRFVHDLYKFNDSNPAINPNYKKISKSAERVGRPSAQREPIVEIHAWCLMVNHYHLLLSERIDGGITLFLRKLNVGYANYFNDRHSRNGTLFQGRTRKQLIERDAHFLYMLHYIHLNPLDLHPKTLRWRVGALQNSKDALALLEKYKWSSYLDYIGSRNFPSILDMKFFREIFKNYGASFKEYLKDLEMASLSQYKLE